MGDRLTDEQGEWEVETPPSALHGGKSLHARLRKVGEPAVVRYVAWPVHEKVVSVAESAEQALRLIDRVIPDVLVSDIALPKRDGFWLVGQVRERLAKQGSVLPAIAVTGRDYSPEQILAAGFQVYVRKPIDPEVLCRAIASVVLK